MNDDAVDWKLMSLQCCTAIVYTVCIVFAIFNFFLKILFLIFCQFSLLFVCCGAATTCCVVFVRFILLYFLYGTYFINLQMGCMS